MEEFLNNISDAIKSTVTKDWMILSFMLSGVFLTFLIVFFLGVFCGDFCRLKKSMKLIIKGERETGLKKMKKQAPDYNPKLEITPPAESFDYDKIVLHPYSYSIIKRSVSVVLIGTVCFIALAVGLCVLTQMGASTTAFCIITGTFLGLALCIFCILFSGASLKRSVALFNKMKQSILSNSVSVEPGYDYIINDIQASEEVNSIYLDIRQFATEGGEYAGLTALFQRLKTEKENPANQDGVNQKMLSEAADILQMLIDSYE